MTITIYYKDVDGKIGHSSHKIADTNHEKVFEQIVNKGVSYPEYGSTILIPPSALIKVIIN